MKKGIYGLATATLLAIGAAPAAHAANFYVAVGGLYTPGAPTSFTVIPGSGHAGKIEWANTLTFSQINSWLVTSAGPGDQTGLVPFVSHIQFDAGPESATKLDLTGPTTLWEKEWTGTYQGQAAQFTEVLRDVTSIDRTQPGQLQVQLAGNLYITEGGDLDDPNSKPILTESASLFLQVQHLNGAWTTTFLDTAGTAPAPGPVPGIGLFGSAALLGFLLTAKARASRG
jgi:hypothetical protein